MITKLKDQFKESGAASKLGVGALALGLALNFNPMTASAEPSQVIEPMQQVSTVQAEYVSPIQRAGEYASKDVNNIGILLIYGTGNGITAEQAGEWAVKKLTNYASEQSKNYDTEYFILHSDKGEGIAISYLVGAVEGVGPLALIKGKDSSILDTVIEKRELTANMLASNTLAKN